MRTLTRLWRSLEAITGLATLPAFWEAYCGPDIDVVRPHLRVTDTQGSLYPCPKRNIGYCPRKIVDYCNGEFAALCRDPYQMCERVSLTQLDVLAHELDLAAFLKPILRAGSIRSEGPEKRGFGTWDLGLSSRRSSLNQPAFLIIVHSEAAFESAVNCLLADIPGPFLILAPTNRFRSVTIQTRLQARNIRYVCLQEQIGLDESGHFVLTDPVDSTDGIAPTPVAARKRIVAEFRVKYACKVSAIHEAAEIHEADYYKWLNGSIPDRYSTCMAIEKVLAEGLPNRRSRQAQHPRIGHDTSLPRT